MSGGMDRDPLNQRDEPAESPFDAARREVRQASQAVRAAQKRLADAEAALLKMARGDT